MRPSLIGSDKLGGDTVKKKHPWLPVLVLVLICAAVTGIYAGIFVLRDDKTAPNISLDSEVLEVSIEATTEELLKGVSAFDNVDGDVTDSVLVEGIGNINEDYEAVITYAAFDSSGNVAKISRTVKFTDYQPPVFGLKRSLSFGENTSPDILGYMTATDMFDGDISGRIKGTLVSNTTSLSYPGIHQVEFRVTNSMGDTRKITLPVEVYKNGIYNANVDLGDNYLIYIKKGEDFTPEQYLESLIVGNNIYSLKNQNPPMENLSKDEIEDLGSDRDLEVRTYINNYVDPEENIDPFVAIVNVDIDNEVKKYVPGIYSVTYTVNYENRYIGYARLNVVVEE